MRVGIESGSVDHDYYCGRFDQKDAEGYRVRLRAFRKAIKTHRFLCASFPFRIALLPCADCRVTTAFFV